MNDVFSQFFTSGSFIPHGHCYLWKPGLVWLHLLSDSLIAVAYYSIPLTLFYFVRHRKDLPFHGIFLLFASFIVACGTTHLMEVWTLWHPIYWVSGGIKALTAGVSLFTAMQLVTLVPQALALPSPAQLEQANVALQNQIQERLKVEEELRQSQNLLEQRVQERTAELVKANDLLQQEIEERQRTEEALRRSEAKFRRLVDANILGVISATTDGAITEANSAFLKMVGYSQEELAAGAVRWDTMTPPEWLNTDAQAIAELAQQGSHTPFEKEYIHKDGHHIPVLIGSALLESRSDTKEAVISFILDLTNLKHTEAELRDSREGLVLAQQIGQIGSCEWNLKTGKLFWTEEMEALFGLAPGTFEGHYQDWLKRVHPDDRSRSNQLALLTAQTGVDFDTEFRIVRTDGVIRWVAARAKVFYDEAGKPDRLIGVNMDITERKQAEESARANSERLGLALTAARMGDWSWNIATDQVTFSARGAEIFGLADGAPITWTELQDRMDENDREFARLAVEEAIANHSDYDIEYRIRRYCQGDLCWVAAKGRAQYEADGKVLGMIGVVQDISDRKQAEADIAALNQNLQNRVNELETLFEVIPIGILIADDLSFTQVRANSGFTRILGLPNNNASATPPPGDPKPTYKILQQGRELAPEETPFRQAILKGEPIERVEVDVLREDGTLFNLYGFASPLFDNQGKPRGGVGAFLDITEIKRAEAEREQLLERERIAREQAEAANRIKDEFLAVLSHELRTPLNPILGWIRLLQTGKLDGQKQAVALETIERNAKLQTQLIEDLLDISRILQGKLTLHITPIHLPNIIQSAQETVRLSAEAKNIDLQLHLEPIASQVMGDSNRIQQVIWNLLSNAIKFTPAGGRVEVTLESYESSVLSAQFKDSTQTLPLKSQNLQPTTQTSNLKTPNSNLTTQTLHRYAQITITDTGKGISPDFLPYVFDTFRQEDGKTTRKFGGLGLGLSIVRRIVELHGGTVEVNSPGEGLGATFTVRLPLMSGPTARPSVQTPTDPGFDLSNLQVLVVDDEADTRLLTAYALEQYGASVITADSATDALQVIRRSPPGLLISDIGMPEMDGYMLMREVRALADPKGKTIPAIALTAYASETDQHQVFQAGFDRHLSKPIEPEVLVREIITLLQEHRPRA